MNIDLTSAAWRKSTKSATNGACVEVADLSGHVAVRDSKNPDGPSLVFVALDWRRFLGTVENK